MNSKRASFQYFAALLMFGMNGVVASHIALSSYEVVFTRTLLGSLFTMLLFALKRQKIRLLNNRKGGFCLFLSGVAMGISWILLYEAYRQLGVGVASLAYYCGPVVVMALSPVLFAEKLTREKVSGFAAVLLGMLLVNMQALQGGKTVWGLFCGIMSAFMYAVMVIFNKKVDGITGSENTMWQMLSGFLTLAVFMGLRQGFSLQIMPESVLPILILGLFNTGLGCYFYFSSIGYLPVQTVAVCGYLEPLSAVLFAALFLDERMTLLQLAGAALIIGGAAFSEGTGRRSTPAVRRLNG